MVRVVVIEGSPDEVTEVINNTQALGGGTPVASGQAQPKPEGEAVNEAKPSNGDETTYVSEDIARRILTRRPLSKEQKIVLKTLAAAYPKYVSAPALHKATGYTSAQFAGLMGAFGRRVTHTEGFVEYTWFFDTEWDYEAGSYNYRLPETVFNAIKAEKII